MRKFVHLNVPTLGAAGVLAIVAGLSSIGEIGQSLVGVYVRVAVAAAGALVLILAVTTVFPNAEGRNPWILIGCIAAATVGFAAGLTELLFWLFFATCRPCP